MPDIRNKLHLRWPVWIVDWEKQMCFEKSTFTIKSIHMNNKFVNDVDIFLEKKFYYKVSGGPMTRTFI